MTGSDCRLPGISVFANGVSVTNVLTIEVQSDSFLGADRFRLYVMFSSADYYTIWNSSSIEVIVSVGLNDCWQELIRGQVDRVEVDVGAGLIHVDGRDLTARLIDSRTQETFENQTSSEIAELLASRRGLTPNVLPTTTMVGRDYGGDHSRVTLDQYSSMTTEWDLLTKLASVEGYDVWIDGETLNFQPPLNSPNPVVVRPSDCQSLRLDRALALSAGLSVTVKSWDCRANAAVSQVASIGDSNSTQNYIFIKPNLTTFEAIDLAQRVLVQIAQNEKVVTLEWPGEMVVKPRQTLALTESNTDFDGLYLITRVERRLSFQHGFTETIQARTPPWTIS